MFAESAIITDEVLKGIEDCIDLAPLSQSQQHQVHSGCAPNPGAENSAGRRLRHGIPSFPAEAGLLVCLPYHLLPPAPHSPLRISRNVAPLCGLPLSGFAQLDARTDARHHAASWQRLLSRCDFAPDTRWTLPWAMTPLEGLVMGTRSGDIDPAIVNLIATKEGLSPHEVEMLLNTQSGLLGISGLTNDMRVLQQELKET